MAFGKKFDKNKAKEKMKRKQQNPLFKRKKFCRFTAAAWRRPSRPWPPLMVGGGERSKIRRREEEETLLPATATKKPPLAGRSLVIFYAFVAICQTEETPYNELARPN